MIKAKLKKSFLVIFHLLSEVSTQQLVFPNCIVYYKITLCQSNKNGTLVLSCVKELEKSSFLMYNKARLEILGY